MASSTWSTTCCCRADGYRRRVGAASAHTPASISRGPPRKRGGPSLGHGWRRVVRLAIGGPVGPPAVGSQVPPIQVEVAPGRSIRIGHDLPVGGSVPLQHVTLGHIRPGHGDQAVRDLIVGRYQGKTQANVGLSTEVLGIWHRAGTPAFSPCNATPLVRFPTNGPRRSFFSPRPPQGSRRQSASPRPAGPPYGPAPGRSVGDPHGLLAGPANLGRLAVAVPERPHAGLRQGVLVEFLDRDPFDALPLLQVRQLHASGDVRAADDRLRLAALGDRVEVVEQALADHGDAEVARADVLLGAIGDPALADPGDDVLIDDVARDPAAALVLDRALPGRHRALHVGLAPFRNPHEEPRNAERILVVDRHAPLEVIAEIECVGPQRDAAYGPMRIALVGILAHALVEEAVVELLELELEMPRRIGTGLAGEPHGPVVVHPFEVHGVAGVLLALEPIA